MIKAYPDKAIVQKTVINGKYVDKPNMWNFFDTLYMIQILRLILEKTFHSVNYGRDIGGKCHAYINGYNCPCRGTSV